MTNKIHNNLLELFWDREKEFGNRGFSYTKKNNVWEEYSFSRIKEETLRLATSMKQQGVSKGDRVIILAHSSSQWIVSDLAIMALGAMSVPVYTTNTEHDHAYVIIDSGATVAIIGDQKLADVFFSASTRLNLNTIFAINTIQADNQTANIIQWNDVLGTKIDEAIQASISNLSREDTACIIYTSGTSGNPTGVMLPHRAILANVYGAAEVISEFNQPLHTMKLVSFLPLSHAYEHTTGLYLMMGIGGTIHFTPSLDKLLDTIADVKPTFVTCVPRLYESIRDRVLKGVRKAGGAKEKLFMRTIELGTKKYENPKSLSVFETIENKALDILVRKKIQNKFGGNILAFVSGGAPLNYGVGAFFMSLDLNILQGYGQTEAAPLISVSSPNNNRIDTVGRPLPGVKVKIAKDGEILVSGDLLMKGYWHKEEKTKETLVDGWLHTGDVGHIDNQGYIHITDRKKDIIINTSGDNISPQRVEGILSLDDSVEQCMVYGDKKPHLVALIVPSQEAIASHVQEGDIASTSVELKTVLQEKVAVMNKSLSTIEKIRRFIVLDESFTTQNELLTNTLKIRRNFIKKKYDEQLESLY